MAGSSWPALSAGARAKASEVESKFDWVEQDIVPMNGGTKTDNTYDLGTSSFRWRNAYIGPGSVGTPAVAIRSADMGIYSSSLSTLNIAVSATSAFQIDSSGRITSPLTVCFSARLINGYAFSSLTSTVSFTADVFDQNSNFDPSSGTFTAPVTGRYQFNFSFPMTMNGLNDLMRVVLKTSNRDYPWQWRNPDFTSTVSPFMTAQLAVIADMDALDTAHIYTAFDTTASIGLISGYFSGYLMA